MKPRQRRPLRITIAVCLVLITTAWNGFRTWTSLAWRSPLEAYAAVPGPSYIGLTGAGFAVFGLVTLWGFWRRASWAPLAFLVGAWVYVAWTWADRLLLQSQGRSSWPFAAIVTAALLGWTTWMSLDKRNHAYFGKEAHGREPENRPSE